MRLFKVSAEPQLTDLEVFDPLRGNLLMRWLDPLPAEHQRTGKAPMVALVRLTATVAIMLAPIFIFSWIRSPLAGGQFWGMGSLSKDIGMIFGISYVLLMLMLLTAGRRKLGALIRDLCRRKIISPDAFREPTDPPEDKGRFYSICENLTRISLQRETVWITALIFFNAASYWISFVGANRVHWSVSPADPGALLYYLRHGANQPNLAGLWLFCVWVPFMAYLTFLAARLLVCFAWVCRKIANDSQLRIIPTHPDGSGGLLLIGRTSLFFSLFTFAVGVCLAGITLSEIVYTQAANDRFSSNIVTLLCMWCAYLLLGSLLFFMPMLPLRSKMAKAQDDYLVEAEGAYADLAEKTRNQIGQCGLNRDQVENQTAAGALISSAQEMAIWPYDRKTLLHFASVLGTPVAAVATKAWPLVWPSIKTYLQI